MRRSFRIPFMTSLFAMAALAIALHSAAPPAITPQKTTAKVKSVTSSKPPIKKITLSKESIACLECHQESATPAATRQWAGSRHATAGVGC